MQRQWSLALDRHFDRFQIDIFLAFQAGLQDAIELSCDASSASERNAYQSPGPGLAGFHKKLTAGNPSRKRNRNLVQGNVGLPVLSNARAKDDREPILSEEDANRVYRVKVKRCFATGVLFLFIIRLVFVVL